MIILVNVETKQKFNYSNTLDLSSQLIQNFIIQKHNLYLQDKRTMFQ